MTELYIEKPNEKQVLFLRDTHRHVGFGGARGGGKSWAVRTKAKLLCAYHAGIRCLIVRRTYPELMNNHIATLRRELSAVAAYSDKEKLLRFKNGSIIQFMYCARDSDLDRLQGVEYDVIFLDEATQLSEFQMKAITACVRGVNDFPKRVYYTMNPGGQGHGYIKRLFIDRRFLPDEDPEDYSFIRSLCTDNEALMRAQPDYVKSLKALPEKLRDAWLHGRWDIFEGQFFEEFITEAPTEKDAKDGGWCHVIDPFPVPDTWSIYRSFDFGYAKPFSCGWWAVDYDGRAYRILELYGCSGEPDCGVKWTPDRIFSEIAKIESEHPFLKNKRITGVADPAIWDASRGESVAETAARHGVLFIPGDNKRIAGWMQVRCRLAFDEEGLPMMYVFKNCRDFIRTLPLLCYDRKAVEDLDTTGEDHIADETRYFCMMRPIAPPKKKAEAVYLNDPLDMMR